MKKIQDSDKRLHKILRRKQMILHTQVNKDGKLNARLPKSLWGKKVVISVRQETETESNWEKISAALEKVDALEIPPRTHDEILSDLRTFKETE